MKSKIMSVIRFILIIIILACLAILGKRLLDYRTNMQNNKAIEDVVKEVEKESANNTTDDASWRIVIRCSERIK